MENLELQLPAFTTAGPACLYNLSMLQEMDDDEYLLEVLGILVRETHNDFIEMKKAWQAGNLDIVCKKAHKIKGSVGVIHADSLTTLLTTIETSGKKEAGNDELAALIDNSVYQYNNLEKALKIEMAGLQK